VGGTLGRIVFGQHVVAPEEQPIDVRNAARPGVNADEGALTLGCLERERLFRCHDEREQRCHELGLAVEEAVDNDLMVAGRQHAPELPPPAVALLGKVAGRGQRSLRAAGQPTHIDIQYLPILRVGMAIALAVLPVDGIPGRCELVDGRLGAGVEGVLHNGLLRAGVAPEGGLQSRVWPDTPIDLHQALDPGEQGDEGIVELVDGRIAHRLLRDVDLLADGAKQIQVVQVHTQGGEACVGRAALHHRDRRLLPSGRLRHGE